MTAGIFAILLGLGGAYTVRDYLSREEAEPAANDMVTVPLAAYDLPPGKRISERDILLVSMPQERSRVYGEAVYLTDPSTIAGRIVMKEIKAGQPFRSPSFYPDGMGPGIAEQLEPGEVAVTIPVYGVGLVAGFVRPGAVVDVIYRSSGDYETTMRLLERAKVLAVGDSFLENARAAYASDGQYRNPAIMATLAVSPYQAQVLKAAENRGELTMTLHNPKNIAVSGFMGDSLANAADFRVHLDQLLGLPIGEKTKSIELYYGSRKSDLIYHRQPIYNPEGHIQTPVTAAPPRGRSPQPYYSSYRMQSSRTMQTTPPDPLENFSEPASKERPAGGRGDDSAALGPPRGQVREAATWAFAPREGGRP
ncbi:MAG: Flp pilus assembly protein CpaB [Planctomycetales bacterium]